MNINPIAYGEGGGGGLFGLLHQTGSQNSRILSARVFKISDFSFMPLEHISGKFICQGVAAVIKVSFRIIDPNQYGGGGGGKLWPHLWFSSISPERLELWPSNFLTFSFCLLVLRKIEICYFWTSLVAIATITLKLLLNKIIKLQNYAIFILICISSQLLSHNFCRHVSIDV